MKKKKRNKKLINEAINDVLEPFPMFWNWSTEEIINLINKEFRNSNNWFYEFVQDFSGQEIKASALEYLQEINFWNLEK